MTAVAGVTWGLLFWTSNGKTHASLSGPEINTGTAPVPEGADFVGVEFDLGTSLRHAPATALVGGGIELPDVTSRRFRLDGRWWETPRPDDVEALVDRLVRSGTLIRDPLVAEVRRSPRLGLSQRTIERRFRAATGLTQGAVRQIERAREAARLLAQGRPTVDVIACLDYFDEPHMARALRRYVGRTATQLRDGAGGPIGLDLDQRKTS